MIDIEYMVLIVEDEDLNYIFLEEMLQDYKVTVIHVKNGMEAVEMVKNNPNINLVLMDIKMPIMNGYEAAKLINEQRPDLPIVFQSCYSLPTDVRKAYANGGVDFIPKPINLDTFSLKMNKFIPSINFK